MRENKFDIVSDEVKRRIGLAIGEAQKRFKNTNPYRQEPMDNRQRLLDFEMQSPQDREFARSNFGDAYAAYEQEMLKLKEKFRAR